MRRSHAIIITVVFSLFVSAWLTTVARAHGAVVIGDVGSDDVLPVIVSNQRSAEEALALGLSKCREMAPKYGATNCRVLSRFHDTCIVWAKGATSYAYELSNSPASLEQEVIQACAKGAKTFSSMSCSATIGCDTPLYQSCINDEDLGACRRVSKLPLLKFSNDAVQQKLKFLEARLAATPANPEPRESGKPAASAASPPKPQAKPVAPKMEHAAGDRVFLKAERACFVSGGIPSKVRFAAKDGQSYYLELIGSTSPVKHNVCDDSGTLGILPGCRDISVYGFITVCSGGYAEAPEVYVALFGLENSNRDFRIDNDQLSYLPGQDAKTRVVFPVGKAPFEGLEKAIEHIPWDEERERPRFKQQLTEDQERRIKALFPAKDGFVEPFTVADLRLAADIAQEQPPTAPKVAVAPDITQPKNQLPKTTSPGKSIPPDWVIWGALMAVVGSVAALKSGATGALFTISVGIVISVVSGLIKYATGIDDQITIVSVPLFLGLALALIWSTS